MAGFNTAVTGLKASSTMLDVAGNNIANSSTVGFKSSRTEFGDIYATAVVGAGSSNTAGSGVTVSDIAQDFSAGTIEFTNNNLDLAINGSGFFQLDDGQGGVTYTRAGAFELNKDGFIVSKSGKYLQGYGLDGEGNRLPIGDLAVTQKESPPKATESMGLSFNIDSRDDATTLLPVYDKNEPSSFTYSTTIRSFDSLGNEHTIKYNFVEQRPEQEFQQYDTTDGAAIRISGIDVTVDDAAPATVAAPFEVVTTTAGSGSQEIWRLSGTKLDELQQADPRIFAVEFYPDAANAPAGTLRVLRAADSLGYGELSVTDQAATPVALTPATIQPEGFVDSNEKHYFEFASTTYPAQTQFTVEVSGVPVTFTTGQNVWSPEQMALAIRDRESEIIEANPLIKSISFDSTQGANGALRIEYKPEVDPDNLGPSTLLVKDDTGNQLFDVANVDAQGFQNTDFRVEGDNSYNGVYRMYAYLNGEEALDIGKVQDPGFGTSTEPGPVIIKFDSTNGLLSGINGQEVRAGSAVPTLTIQGADPADPNKEIKLDIAGSTQFASASIIKSSVQDGYTKGDLIGVSFGANGEMMASFSNGENQALGIVAMATFENQSGLQPSGDTEWTATLTSGNAILNPPGTGLNGLLRSAALEQSNVDLSAELVKLIEAQRNFQANSKTLETLNTVTQSILQI